MKENGKAFRGTGRATKALCIALLLIVTLVWGYGLIVSDDALTGGMGVFTMLAGRFLSAAVVLFFVRACLFGRKCYARFTAKEAGVGMLIGATNFLGFLFQSAGLLYTDTARSGMLTGGYVIFVPLVCCVLKRKFRLKPVINALIFLVGMAFLFDVRSVGSSFNPGDALTLLSAVFFAAQILLVDKFAGGVNIFNFNVAQMLTMGLLGLAGALAFELPSLSAVDWKICLPAVLYLGVFSSAFAYLVQAFAQSRLSPSLTAILLSLESLAGVLFSLMVGNAAWAPSLAIGCVVMLAACISAATDDSEEQKDPLPVAKGGGAFGRPCVVRMKK